jgi:hypothetical protein
MRSVHLVVLGLSAVLLGNAVADSEQASTGKSETMSASQTAVTHIGTAADLERLVESRPGDAAELRDMLEAINHRTLTDMRRIVRTRFQGANLSTNELAVLTSWPAQRNLTLDVNGRPYRVRLSLGADGEHYLPGLYTPAAPLSTNEESEVVVAIEHVVTPPVRGSDR